MLSKATAIDPGYALAYYVKSFTLFLTKRPSEALEAAQTAVALDPNAATGYYAMGRAKSSLGRCERSIAHETGLRPKPRDPLSGLWHVVLGGSGRPGRLNAGDCGV